MDEGSKGVNMPAVSIWKACKVTNGEWLEVDDPIATEKPLTVIVNGEEFATIVSTPTHLRELTIGFLASEGIIRAIDDIVTLTFNDGQGYAYVQINSNIEMRVNQTGHRFIGSCCGKSRQFYFQSDARTAVTVMTQTRVTVQQCLALMEELKRRSSTFIETGGVHNAAFCSPDQMMAVRSDIGRHNALDKLYGHILENKIRTKEGVIAFSGRISSEVVLKVAKMGIGILLSKSAPTDLALKLADDLNITAVGFIRQDRMNIYTHPERVERTGM